MPTPIATLAAEAGASPARSVVLRPAGPDDESFLDDVYASTRADEMALTGWDAGTVAAFLRMQAALQRRSYHMRAGATDAVVLVDGEPIGRMFVERSGEAIAVLDMALLPAHRGRGVGTVLLRRLQAEADDAGLPVRLQVEHGNPARRLYERMGFVETGRDQVRTAMERPAGGGPR